MQAQAVTTAHRHLRQALHSQRLHGRWVTVALCLVLAACSTGGSAHAPVEYLDEGTGITITRLGAPMVFFSDQPSLATNVRDYIYAAPVAVNEAGHRSYWLWLAAWSTMDHAVAGEDPATAIGTVRLLLDGEPLELDGSASSSTVPGTRHPPYVAPVSGARTLVLPMSASQLRRLAAARDIVLHAKAISEQDRYWLRWSAANGLPEFVALVLPEQATNRQAAAPGDIRP